MVCLRRVVVAPKLGATRPGGTSPLVGVDTAYARCVVAADLRAARAGVLEQSRPTASRRLVRRGRDDGRRPGDRLRRLLPVRGRPALRAAVGDVLQARPRGPHRTARPQRDRRARPQPVRRPRAGAASRGPAGTRKQPHATQPAPVQHPAPEGYASELRLALVSGNRSWGAVSLFRDDVRHPFTDADVERSAGPVRAAQPGGTPLPGRTPGHPASTATSGRGHGRRRRPTGGRHPGGARLAGGPRGLVAVRRNRGRREPHRARGGPGRARWSRAGLPRADAAR